MRIDMNVCMVVSIVERNGEKWSKREVIEPPRVRMFVTHCTAPSKRLISVRVSLTDAPNLPHPRHPPPLRLLWLPDQTTRDRVQKWLEASGLPAYIVPEYMDKFISAGFEDIDMLDNDGVTQEDLAAIGIKRGHQKKLLTWLASKDDADDEDDGSDDDEDDDESDDESDDDDESD